MQRLRWSVRRTSNRLFSALDTAKHQRFNLCDNETTSVFKDFLDEFDNKLGVCSVNGKHPANSIHPPSAGRMSALADDQIRIGEKVD